MKLNNIEYLLEKIGLTAQKRALHIQFSNPNLNTKVVNVLQQVW